MSENAARHERDEPEPEMQRVGAQPDAGPATVPSVVPLTILESVRLHDRPKEVLEEEDLPSALPRRLGLTGVVDVQIRRYSDAMRRRQAIPTGEVVNLVQLVLRRPDAEDILREAGREVARRMARGPLSRVARAVPVRPRFLARALARCRTRAMMGRIAGGRIEVTGNPVTVRAGRSFTGLADVEGKACVFYSAAIEEMFALLTHDRPEVEQTECRAGGAPACVWSVMQT